VIHRRAFGFEPARAFLPSDPFVDDATAAHATKCTRAAGPSATFSAARGFCETGLPLRAGPANVVFGLSVSVGLVRRAVRSGRPRVAIGLGLLFAGLAALTA